MRPMQAPMQPMQESAVPLGYPWARQGWGWSRASKDKGRLKEGAGGLEPLKPGSASRCVVQYTAILQLHPQGQLNAVR